MSANVSSFPESFDTQTWFLPAKNNLRTTVLTSVSISQNNVINVESTNEFPGEGVISIGKEVIYYRSKTATSFRNLIRGFDGTFADSHQNGAAVELRWIAGHHNRTVDSIRAIQRTIGINPQGQFPDIRSRLDAIGNTVPRKTDVIPLRNDGLNLAQTGYRPDGTYLSRMFRSQEPFIALTSPGSGVKYDIIGPEFHIDGIRQERNPTMFLSENLPISSINVSGRTITISSGNFIADGASPGDLIVVKQTPSNDDAYIIETVNSATQVTVEDTIFGSNVSNAGMVDVVSTSDLVTPFMDYVCVRAVSPDEDTCDAVVFLNPPDVNQRVRMDYSIKLSDASIFYESPVAAQATYQVPSQAGSIAASDDSEFVLHIGKPRAIAFRVRLTGASSNVDIAVFGNSAMTELQYLAQNIDLTIGEFNDYGLWHFRNMDNPVGYNMYVRITNNGSSTLEYTLEIELEALGDYA